MKKWIRLLIILLYPFAGFGQNSNISGIINDYIPVVAIDSCSNSVTVTSSTAFSIGDRVLIIQMKGADIDLTNTSSFGSIINYNDAGNYEFANIAFISANQISFVNTISNSYSVSGRIQLVRVPQYDDATITSTLTCIPWNGVTGGIVALELSGTLTFNADIDVSEDGFRGGTAVDVPSSSNCGNPNYFYPAPPSNAAYKGEGIVELASAYQTGRGQAANGGGGGNGWNHGGGGGSNAGLGGNSGTDWCVYSGTSSTYYPSIGGQVMAYSNSVNKVFAGGGGGSGEMNNNVGTGGANGGGIVIISALSLDGNSYNIKANGGNALTASNDGAGGGGAGGSVLLNVSSYSSQVNVECNGGNGGSNTGHPGSGGGGGGGVLWTSNTNIHPNINYQLNGGLSGTFSGSNWNSTDGLPGDTLSKMIINQGTVAFTPLFCQSTECVDTADFNTWSQQGQPSNGNWIIQSGGSSLYQTINSIPTYFVTPTDFINVEINGTIRVDQNGDNDFIGFVFGYKSPMGVNYIDHEYYLFSWKHSAQTIGSQTAQEGFALVKLFGVVSPPVNSTYEQYFWGFPNTPNLMQRIATNYGSTLGWDYDTDYSVYLCYTANRIIIKVDGTTIFDVPGCYEPGRFGFYNNSQEKVRYSGFSYNLKGDFDIPSAACQNDTVNFVFADSCVSSSYVFSNIYAMLYDFGDGDSIIVSNPNGSNANVSHVYQSAGTYQSSMILVDWNGCSDTTIKMITINPTPSTPLISGDSSLCIGETLSLNASSNAGASYEWTFPDNSVNSNQSFTVSNVQMPDSGIYSIQTELNSCVSSSSSISIEINENPVTSTSIQDVSCNGAGDGTATAIILGGSPTYTYNWSNGSTNNPNSNLNGGSYLLTVTDANSCSDTSSATIDEPSVLALSISSTPALCYGTASGIADLSITGGSTPYTYNWSHGAFSQDATGLTSGTYSVTVTDSNSCTDSISVFVDQADSLSLSGLITDAACFGDSSGSIDLSVSGGTAGYNYIWSTGDSLQDVSSLIKGSYSVTVNDVNNCSDSISFNVNEAPLLILSGSSIDVSCFGGSDASIDLNVSGGTSPYTYVWSNGQSSQDITGLSIGVFSVTVSDANLCEDTISFSIDEPTIIVLADSTIPVSCYGGSDGMVFLDVSGGISPYTYLWSNTSPLRDQSSLSAGTFTVTVTDSNSCTMSLSSIIIEPSLLTSNINVVSHVTCNTFSDGWAIVDANGGSALYTYLWSAGSTDSLQSNLQAGTYTVTTSDSNSCTSVASIVITEPSVLTSSISNIVNVTCFGVADGSMMVSGSGGTSPYLFNWSNSETSTQVNNLVPGTYLVTVTDSNSCVTIDSAAITEPTSLSSSVTSVDSASCKGASDGSASVLANGGTAPYTYQWFNGESNTLISALAAGSYAYSATDANGCLFTDTAHVLEPYELILSIDSISDVSCYDGNDAVALASAKGGTPSYSYSWSSGGFENLETNLYAGDFEISVSDIKGCETSMQFVINQPKEIITFATLGRVACPNEPGGTISLINNGGVGNYSYEWSNGDSSSNISDLLTVGPYEVTITDENGCTVYEEYMLDECTSILYVPNVFSPNSDGKNDIFRAYGSNIKDFNLQIFNRWGEMLFESIDLELGWDGSYQGNPLPASTYIWQIYYEGYDESKFGEKISGSVTIFR